MEGHKLLNYLKRAPKTPGVYVWRDAGRRPLYIGKAANVRSRLSNYQKPTDPRIRAMVAHAATLTWQTTDTDIEALILESQLIKKLKPRYNIDWRDDKNYFYVEFSKETFPRIVLTHQPKGDFVGPFTEGIPLKATLRVLRNLFPYCTCKQMHHLRCLNAHIGKCPGYCCLKTPPTSAQKKDYARNIRAIRDVLTGKRDALVRKLARTMPDTALKLLRVFQNAQINARNQKLAEHPGAPARVEGYDVANISGQHAVGAMVVFTSGTPDKSEYRLFNIKGKGGLVPRSFSVGGDTDMLREMLERRIKNSWPLPDLVVIDGGKAQLNVAKKIFGARTPIVAVTKNDRHQASKLIGATADRALAFAVDAESHRFAISRYRLKHRKSIK
jgi:excinuclease ABC subunit C